MDIVYRSTDDNISNEKYWPKEKLYGAIRYKKKKLSDMQKQIVY